MMIKKLGAVILMFKRFYFLNKAFVWIVFSYVFMVLFARNLPLFWDMTYISEVADTILDSGFTQFINPEIDNGTPPLFSFMLALVWTIFSKSLWASHLLGATFFIGFLWQLNRFSNHFLTQKSKIFLFVLLFADPVFLMQSLLVGYDIAILFCTILAVNSILEKKYFWLSLALIPIPLLNLRGFSFVLILFFIHLWMSRKELRIKFILPYLPAFICMFLWMIYHKSVSGFFVVSTANESLHQMVGLKYFLKSILLSTWKILDFNRFLVLIGILWMWYYNRKQQGEGKIPLVLGLFSFLVFIFVFLLFRYPLSHRYLMFTSLMILIVFVQMIESYSFAKQKLIVALSAILLFLGNFYFYPQKYGNAWDCSLKGLNYLQSKEIVLSDLKRNGQNNCTIAAFFPEIRDQKFAYLDNRYQMHFVDYKAENLKNVDFLMYSNAFNILPLSLSELENKGFRFYKSYESGFVTISLYKNTFKNIER